MKRNAPSLIILVIISLLSCNSSETREDADVLYKYDVEQRISELGITLSQPELPKNNLNLIFARRTGNLLFLSGNGPIKPNGEMVTGKVGIDLSVEEAYQAARLTAVNQLSVLKSEIGDLNKVVRIVKVNGMVNTHESFTEHSQVINGFSDLMVEVFGERGKHARSAVGMAALPWNTACEVEVVVEVRD